MADFYEARLNDVLDVLEMVWARVHIDPHAETPLLPRRPYRGQARPTSPAARPPVRLHPVSQRRGGPAGRT